MLGFGVAELRKKNMKEEDRQAKHFLINYAHFRCCDTSFTSFLHSLSRNAVFGALWGFLMVTFVPLYSVSSAMSAVGPHKTVPDT